MHGCSHYSKVDAESVDVIHVLYGYMSGKHAFGSVCVGFTRFHYQQRCSSKLIFLSSFGVTVTWPRKTSSFVPFDFRTPLVYGQSF